MKTFLKGWLHWADEEGEFVTDLLVGTRRISVYLDSYKLWPLFVKLGKLIKPNFVGGTAFQQETSTLLGWG